MTAHSHRRIGLLGGSFNPAHDGHRHLSLEALKHLGLDEVWWLVSPQNPLKKTDDMAPYETRLASARRVANHPKIRVLDIERQLKTRFTIDTLLALLRRYPDTHFVWLMGADNLAQFHRWRRWGGIFRRMPIAVFDRAPFSHTALRKKAGLRFAAQRVPERLNRRLPLLPPPRWTFIYMARHPESSTNIRRNSQDYNT